MQLLWPWEHGRPSKDLTPHSELDISCSNPDNCVIDRPEVTLKVLSRWVIGMHEYCSYGKMLWKVWNTTSVFPKINFELCCPVMPSPFHKKLTKLFSDYARHYHTYVSFFLPFCSLPCNHALSFKYCMNLKYSFHNKPLFKSTVK